MVLKSISDCLKAVPQKMFPVEIKYIRKCRIIYAAQLMRKDITVTFPLPVILDQ